MNLSIARKHIEKLYLDTCDILEFKSVENPDTHITEMQEVVVHSDVPCKVSHKTITQAGDGVSSAISLVSKLIINPDIEIKAGSKIIVRRNGVETVYKNSGEAARFYNHQEIVLESFDGWA